MRGGSLLKTFFVAMIAFAVGAVGTSGDLALPEFHFGGYDAGYEEGYNAGYDDGKYDWKQTFYENGYEDGYSDGVSYGRGLQAAVDKGSGTTKSSSNRSTSKQPTEIVYITNTGSKYHRWGCQYLRESCIETMLVNAAMQGYDACSRCY